MGRSRAAGSLSLLAGLVLLPLGTAAQETHDHRYPLLDQLHEDALAALTASTTSFPAELKEAAKRHARVAETRPLDDVRRFDCLADQSALLYATGDRAGALRFMRQAAEHARLTGDVFRAATAFVDAAILANETGDGTSALDLLQQARLLTHSPYLGDEERAAILGRIERQP